MEPTTCRRSSRILTTTLRKNDKKALLKLIQSGASVNIPDYSGNYPLHIATCERNSEMVRLLLENGAAVDPKNDIDERPYDIALKLQDADTMKVLLKNNACVNVTDTSQFSKDFPRELVQLFYEAVDISDSTPEGFTALHLAVKHNDVNGVQRLLARGADPNKLSETGGTSPLHISKTAECTKLLLRYGADPNIMDKFNCVPMFTVMMSDQFETPINREEQGRIVEILFESGADGADIITAVNVALDYGKFSSNMEGLREVIKQIALKKSMTDNTIPIELMRTVETSELRHYYKKCVQEIKLLKEENIYNDITAYDFVKSSYKHLCKYVRIREVYKKLNTNRMKYKTQFKIYSEILLRHFGDAVADLKLQTQASHGIASIMKCVTSQDLITVKILNYLTEEDMKNLVKAIPC